MSHEFSLVPPSNDSLRLRACRVLTSICCLLFSTTTAAKADLFFFILNRNWLCFSKFATLCRSVAFTLLEKQQKKHRKKAQKIIARQTIRVQFRVCASTGRLCLAHCRHIVSNAKVVSLLHRCRLHYFSLKIIRFCVQLYIVAGCWCSTSEATRTATLTHSHHIDFTGNVQWMW